MGIETSTTANGVTVKYEGWYVAYIGTKEDLLASGLAQDWMLPRGNEKRRSSRLGSDMPAHENAYFCCSLLQSGQYRVTRINPMFEHKFVSDVEPPRSSERDPVINLLEYEAVRRSRIRRGLGVVVAFPSGKTVAPGTGS